MTGRRGRRRPGLPGAARRPVRFRAPRRPEVIDRLDRAGLLPGDHLHLQPGGLRGRGPPVPGRRCPAHHAGRGRRDHRDRRAAHQGHPPGRPARARLRRVAHRPAAWHRRAPRGDAAHLQGSSRGTLRGGPGPRRLRHRDAGPGHQHAGPDGGGGTAGQVERRDPRGPDAGGVHAAHRPGRPPRHRRGRARRGALAARRGPAGGGRAGLHPHLPAQLQLPALLQHGGEPGRPGRPGQGDRAAGVVVRPVPGGPGGGRHRPAGPPRPRAALADLGPRATAETTRSTTRCARNWPAGRRTRPGNVRRTAGRRPGSRWSSCAAGTSSWSPAAGGRVSRSSWIPAWPAARRSGVR